CPGGEREDHASLLTRSFGFESWSGHWIIRAVSSAGQSACMTRWRPQVRPPPLPLRREPVGSTTLSMVSVVLTAARESVELEATGSTPAGHPQCKLGGGDDDPERAGSPHAGPEPELATGERHDRGAGPRHALERDGEGRRAGRSTGSTTGPPGPSSSLCTVVRACVRPTGASGFPRSSALRTTTVCPGRP